MRKITLCILMISFSQPIFEKLTRAREGRFWYLAYIGAMFLIAVLSPHWFSRRNQTLRRKYEYLLALTILPYAAGVIYTLVIILMSGQYMVNSFPRSLSITFTAACRLLLAEMLVIRFRERALDILAEAVIVLYAGLMVYALARIGPAGIARYVALMVLTPNTGLNGYFEYHDIGLSVGILLMHQLFFKKHTSWPVSIMLFLIMVLCWKRIAIFAFIVSCAFFVFLRSGSDNELRKARVNFTLLAVLCGCFAYVMLISTGALYSLAAEYGFDFSNRIGLFALMSRFYYWSVLFPGNGLGWTGKYFTVGRYSGLLGAGAAHNDILTMYIDLGFIGSFLWFGWNLLVIPKKLARRYGSHVSFVYSLLMVYSYVVYTTDNSIGYFVFQLFLFSVLAVSMS